MPLFAGRYVALSRHAWERIHARAVPQQAVRAAIEDPFSTRELEDGRVLCSVPAPVRSRWAWVQVVLRREDDGRLVVITVYPRERGSATAAA